MRTALRSVSTWADDHPDFAVDPDTDHDHDQPCEAAAEVTAALSAPQPVLCTQDAPRGFAVSIRVRRCHRVFAHTVPR